MRNRQRVSERLLVSLFYVFVFCRAEWGRDGQWRCWVLWPLCISSKAYFIFIVAELRCAFD